MNRASNKVGMIQSLFSNFDLILGQYIQYTQKFVAFIDSKQYDMVVRRLVRVYISITIICPFFIVIGSVNKG